MLNLLSPAELDAADAFAGIDARGFIFASAMAIKTNKNMIMLRKKGKLPPPTVHKNYGLEYGTASIETRYQKPLNIIIVDDVLATGGTLEAAADLCLEAGHNVRALVTLINLAHLNNFSWKHLKAHSLISYDE